MSDRALTVALVGCGLIGRKRVQALGGARLAACADIVGARAADLAATAPGCQSFSDWRDMLAKTDCDAVIVATLHDSLAQIAHGALNAGRHVLVEKPAAREASELEPLLPLARAKGLRVRVGFNHRYHRALLKARELVDAGALGELMFVRARYGHGGRLGYEREWRADRKLSGGGELIDQGPHLIDLARWFLGDFTTVQGFAQTYFWNMPVDDNAFMLLRTRERKAAMLHASWTEWKNMFSFEIYGKTGKIDINGLGGSYGTERITFYRMLPQMGPPETTAWEYPGSDDSWEREFAEFADDIRLKRASAPGLEDAIAVLRIVERIYKDAGNDHRP